MKERPILFSSPMVRAILDGRKTETRRVYKPTESSPWEILGEDENGKPWPFVQDEYGDFTLRPCPYGEVGDRLWVRETWADLRGKGFDTEVAYKASTGSEGDEVRKSYGIKWRPSIHMPRALSRISLEITGVRVERLQEITECDALAEGCSRGGSWDTAPSLQYRDLWEQINGPDSWDLNPWVWVIQFKRV